MDKKIILTEAPCCEVPCRKFTDGGLKLKWLNVHTIR
jgi:hypothetical protein